MPLSEEVEIRGPTGDIVYLGHSDFLITGSFSPQPRKLHSPRVSLVLGGSGITPGYALMARVLQTEGNETEVKGVDANKTGEDIMLKGELDRFEKESDGRVRVVHVLSHGGEEWKRKRGRVDGEVLRRVLFPPEEGSVVSLCGPPGLVQKAALPALKGTCSCCSGTKGVSGC
jgi:nitrate reductase (NAD(P)H)